MHLSTRAFLGAVFLLSGIAAAAPSSAFYPPHLLERIRANADKDDWGRDIRKRAIDAAEPWRKMSDEQLWKLVFGATIPRSWHVFSNGHCPACQKNVPMYDWKIDAIKQPWKVRCPHCSELFPKNDFAKFHESGLDEHGIFDPKKADRALLFNTEHADASDPKRMFGVDDGTGYVDGDKRWRFISTYLVYGQWKQAVEGGIKALATAYILSGDKTYAHKAGVLLDRVADVYPTFDFKTQGILYESVRADGYVSVWHDSTIETRELALSFDAVKDAIAADEELARFLAAKAGHFKPPLPKSSPADVIKNIEQRILRDALASPHKIYSNFPQRELTAAVIQTALAWPANREEVLKGLAPAIEQATAVDGVTGEKGLAGYSAYAAQRLGEFLGYYARMDEKFLPEMIARHPRLPQMYRFFIDTWIAERYYPTCGDAGSFAGEHRSYAGLTLSKNHAVGAGGHGDALLTPSMYTLLWQLYEATKDPAFAQVLHQQNNSKLDGLPYDLFHPDPEKLRRELQRVIDEHGVEIKLASVNKPAWRLAILRAGKGDHRRAVWLDYDSGGGHGHADGMNLGLVARGLDLMPDFGYPPVQYGGWGSPRAQWYTSTAAHNTVVVDGANQPMTAGDGKLTTWETRERGVQVMTASSPALNAGRKFERMVALVDVDDDDFYAVDIFRVAGGKDHAKFFMSHFATITPSSDLAMQTADDYSHPQMRNFRKAADAKPGWSIDFAVEDRYKLLRSDQPGVNVRYTDFTGGADAYTCEAWVVAGTYNSNTETWVPRVMTRRRNASGAADFSSNFVSLLQPHDAGGAPPVKSARRLASEPASDANVVLLVELGDGRRDLIVSGETPLVVNDASAALSLELAEPAPYLQVRVDGAGGSTVVAGNKAAVKSLKIQGVDRPVK